jgi:thiamine-monophosphate kinase
LALSLYEISKASKVGFLINELPISQEVKMFAKVNKFDPFELTFYGGEEYELVLTITPKHWKKAKEAIRSVGGRIFLIGKVVKGKKILFSGNKSVTVIEQRGWEHFK